MHAYDTTFVDAREGEPRRSDDAEVLRNERRAAQAVLQHAARHYQGALATSPEALQYLRARGVRRDAVRRYAIGYARPVWRDLHRVFRDHHDDAVIASGLIVCKDGNFDRFRHRIMFPIRDVNGAVIGFGGRTLSRDESLHAKYMNSPDSEIFHKRKTLYGLYEARAAIEFLGSAILVEGFFDVIQLAQCGIENVVATMGTSCTHDHLAGALAYTDNLTFCFDADAAGQRAVTAALHAVLPFATDDRKIRFALLPAGHDPDSLCRQQGAPAFHAAVAHAVSLRDLILERINDDVDTRYAEGRAKLLHQARAIWRALPPGNSKEDLVQTCCAVGALSREEILDLWRAGRGVGRPAVTPGSTN